MSKITNRGVHGVSLLTLLPIGGLSRKSLHLCKRYITDYDKIKVVEKFVGVTIG